MSNVHLADNWHLYPDRIPVLAVPRSGGARQQEIQHRQGQLPSDLVGHPTFAKDSPDWDTWFRNEHEATRLSSSAASIGVGEGGTGGGGAARGRAGGGGPHLKQVLEDSLRTQ